MSTPKQPPSQRVLDDLVANLGVAERYMFLSDCLFYLPNANPMEVHEHREGILAVFESAVTMVVLVSLRRCLDASSGSSGLVALQKAGRVGELPLTDALLARINMLLDKLIVHTDPRVPVERVASIQAVTRGELRATLAEARAAIELVRSDAGFPAPVRTDTSEIENCFNALLADIHDAAVLRQLRNRAAAGLRIDPRDLLSEAEAPRHRRF